MIKPEVNTSCPADALSTVKDDAREKMSIASRLKSCINTSNTVFEKYAGSLPFPFSDVLGSVAGIAANQYLPVKHDTGRLVVSALTAGIVRDVARPDDSYRSSGFIKQLCLSSWSTLTSNGAASICISTGLAVAGEYVKSVHKAKDLLILTEIKEMLTDGKIIKGHNECESREINALLEDLKCSDLDKAEKANRVLSRYQSIIEYLKLRQDVLQQYVQDAHQDIKQHKNIMPEMVNEKLLREVALLIEDQRVTVQFYRYENALAESKLGGIIISTHTPGTFSFLRSQLGLDYNVLKDMKDDRIIGLICDAVDGFRKKNAEFSIPVIMYMTGMEIYPISMDACEARDRKLADDSHQNIPAHAPVKQPVMPVQGNSYAFEIDSAPRPQTVRNRKAPRITLPEVIKPIIRSSPSLPNEVAMSEKVAELYETRLSDKEKSRIDNIMQSIRLGEVKKRSIFGYYKYDSIADCDRGRGDYRLLVKKIESNKFILTHILSYHGNRIKYLE